MSKNSIIRLLSYDTIELPVYLEIAQTSNYGLLVIEGRPSDKQLAEQWEAIVVRNSQANGFSLENYEDDLKTYAELLGTYEKVRLSLLECMFVIDNETIAFLEEKGFKLDRSSASKYAKSIQACLQKSKNILTKLKTKYNEIQASNTVDKKAPVKTSVEEVLANISVSMGFNVEPTVTLARFNEYKKIVRKRAEKSKRAA